MIIKDGKGLEFRAVEEKDQDLLKKLINDPKIEQMVVGWSYPVSDHRQMEWFNNIRKDKSSIRLMVEAKDIGTIGFASISDLDLKNSTASINTKILNTKETRNQGFGTRLLKMLLDYSFDQLNLNCIIADCLHYNVPSRKTLEKFNFKYEGTLRERIFKDGAYHDLYSYSLLKDDY